MPANKYHRDDFYIYISTFLFVFYIFKKYIFQISFATGFYVKNPFFSFSFSFFFSPPIPIDILNIREKMAKIKK